MAVTLYDLLPDSTKAKYPFDGFRPKMRKALSTEIPDEYPTEKAAALVAQYDEPKLAKHTIGAKNPMLSGHQEAEYARFADMPDRQSAINASRLWESESPLMHGVLEAGAGVMETLPSLDLTGRENRAPQVPAPRSRGERMSRVAGQVTAFGAEAAPIALTAGAAGVPALAASALSAGVPAALSKGTLKNRAISGGTMAALGAAGHAASGAAAAALGEKAGSVVGLGANTALFGGAAPYAEAAVHKATGEQVSWPKAADVARGMGELGLVSLLQHGAGAGAGAARDAVTRGAPPPPTPVSSTPSESPAIGNEAPAASISAPAQRRPIPQPRPARQAVSFPPMDADGYKVVNAIARGNHEVGSSRGPLLNDQPNHLDQGRTSLEGFSARLTAGMQAGASPEEAARQARREVVGLRMLEQATVPPPGGHPDQIVLGEQMTRQMHDGMVGKPFTFKGHDGKPVAGEVVTVSVFPWAPEQVRVVLHDGATDQLAPIFFKDMADFRERAVAIGRQQSTAEQAPTDPNALDQPRTEPSLELMRKGPQLSVGDQPVADPNAPDQPRPEPVPDLMRRGPQLALAPVEEASPKGGPVEAARPAPAREPAPAPQAAPNRARANAEVDAAAPASRAAEAEVRAPVRPPRGSRSELERARVDEPGTTENRNRDNGAAAKQAAEAAAAPATKFQKGQRVKVPGSPDWKKPKKGMTPYRGEVVGYAEPDAKGEPQVRVFVMRGGSKTGAQKFSKITGKMSVPRARGYEYTVPEKSIRRVLTADESAAAAKKKFGGMYRRMTLQAGGDPEAAREMVAELEAKQDKIMAERSDDPADEPADRRRWAEAGRQANVARQVLAEAEKGPSEGSGLREVGAAVRARFEYGHDRTAAMEAVERDDLGVPEVEALAASVKRIRKQHPAATVEAAHRVAGHVVAAEARFVAETRAQMDAVKESNHENKDAEIGLLGNLRKDAARAKTIREGLEAQIAAAKGDPSALWKAQQWGEAEMARAPFGPEAGGTTIFSEIAGAGGAAGRWISRRLIAGVPRAFRRQIAKDARANEVRLGDGSGAVDRVKINEFIDDPYARNAWARIMTHIRMAGGRLYLPRKMLLSYQSGQALHALYEEKFANHLWLKAMGSPKTAKYFAQYGRGSEELGKALSGEKHAIPSEHVGAVGRVRATFAEDGPLWQMVLDHAKEMDQEPPHYRKDWFFPHIVEGERSSPLGKLLEAIELREPGKISDEEFAERHNRFYERRENNPNYLRDATLAFHVYMGEVAKKFAYDQFLKDAHEYLTSDEALGSERTRANFVRDFVRHAMMRKKGRIESMMDYGMRRILFSKFRRGIDDVPLAAVAKVLGKSPDELKLQGAERVSWVPPGVEYRAPDDAVVLGRSNDNGTYVGYRRDGGNVFSSEGVELRKPFEAAMRLATDKFKFLTGKVAPDNEADYRRNAKVADGILRLERDPFSAAVNAIKHRTSLGVVGWNLRMVNNNAGNTFITTYPEYGAQAYVDGARGAAKAVAAKIQRAALNAKTSFEEKMGWLTAEDAAAARKALPLLREEVYAEAAGSSQGEIHKSREELRNIMEGRDPKVMGILNAVGPYGIYGAVEGLNRTADIIAADSYARRTLGMDRAATGEIADGLGAWRRQMADALRDPNSAESFSSLGVNTTQFTNNALGVPLWALNPAGRLALHLGTWPLNYTQNYVIRTTAGALRVVGAAARGAADAAMGGRLGEKAAPASGVEPKNWFEKWMEYNGAGYHERHAAAVFTRQMAMSAVLLGLTDATHINVGVYGVAPQFVAGMAILRKFFPDNEALERWFKTGEYDAAWAFSRGIPVGPTLGLIGDLGPKISKWAVGDKEEIHFPWREVLNAVRRPMVAGDVELQRIIRENPTEFESMPWIFKLFGVEKALYDPATPGQNFRHHFGLTTPSEDREAEGDVPE